MFVVLDFGLLADFRFEFVLVIIGLIVVIRFLGFEC